TAVAQREIEPDAMSKVGLARRRRIAPVSGQKSIYDERDSWLKCDRATTRIVGWWRWISHHAERATRAERAARQNPIGLSTDARELKDRRKRRRTRRTTVVVAATGYGDEGAAASGVDLKNGVKVATARTDRD